MSAANEGPEGKKPSALIDLKATEVKASAESGAKAGSASGGSGAKDAGTKSANPKSDADSASASSSGGGSSGGGQGPTAGPGKVARGGGLGSVLTHTVAGLVGGLLALLAADTVGPQLGLNGGNRKEATDALQKRMADVEQKVTAARSPDAGAARALAAAEKRIGELESSIQRLSAVEAASTKLAEETKALREAIGKGPSGEDPRLTKLQDQLATLAAAAGTDNEKRIPQLAAITGKIADLETTIGNQVGQLRRTIGQEIDQRLAPVAEASEAARSGTQRIDREVASLKSETVRLGERIETTKVASDKLGEAVRALEQNVGQLKTSLAGELKGVSRPADLSAAVSPLAQKVGQLEASLKDVVKSEQDRRSSAEQIVLSLELGNLKRAVERGGAFAKELADVQALAGTRLNLAPLAKFKDKGVATPVDLAGEFRSVANAILDAEGTPADASVVDRLLSGAKSVVRVRKVGHDPNDKSAEAVVGRMETALKEGRLAGVIEEAKSLGERGQAAAKSWLEKVEARHAVETAIAEVDKQLKTTIGAAAAPAKGVN